MSTATLNTSHTSTTHPAKRGKVSYTVETLADKVTPDELDRAFHKWIYATYPGITGAHSIAIARNQTAWKLFTSTPEGVAALNARKVRLEAEAAEAEAAKNAAKRVTVSQLDAALQAGLITAEQLAAIVAMGK